MNKILFCDNSLQGLLNFRSEVINSYVSDGWQVVIVAPQNVTLELNRPNIKFIPIQLSRSGMNPFEDMKYMVSLYKIYKTERPDFIFHYTIKPNIYGSITAGFLGIHSAAMIPGLGHVFFNRGIGCFIARLLYKYALRYADFVMVLNRFGYDTCIKQKIASPEQLIWLRGGEGVNLEYFQK